MFFLVLIFVFIGLCFFNRIQEGNCVLIFANIGAGKTTLLSRYAQKELKKIKKGKSKFKSIIANTPIAGCVYVPNIRGLLQTSSPEHTLILVDEAGIVWNNRKMKIKDEEIEYLKLIRHYHSKLVAISQSHDDVDITIRRIYTNMYLLNKISQYTLVRPIRKYVSIDKETEQIIDGYKFRSVFSWGLLFRPFYYKYFDSYYKPDNGRTDPNLKPFEVVPYEKTKFDKVVEKIKEKIIKIKMIFLLLKYKFILIKRRLKKKLQIKKET
ncbi:MAG TPA: zonular occludens toxin domain-containing protein [Edaphocola sp.]|nr:zonular occludens toxin domain-containing protein [Edaphocola sp.]